MLPKQVLFFFWVSVKFQVFCDYDLFYHEFKHWMRPLFPELLHSRPYNTPVCERFRSSDDNQYACQANSGMKKDCHYYRGVCFCMSCVVPGVSRRYEHSNVKPAQYDQDATVLDLRMIGALRAGTHLLKAMSYPTTKLQERGSLDSTCAVVAKYATQNKEFHMRGFYQTVLRGQIHNVTTLLEMGVRFLDISVCYDENKVLRSCNCLEGQRLDLIFREIYLFSFKTGRKDIIIVNIRVYPANTTYPELTFLIYDIDIVTRPYVITDLSTCSTIKKWPPKVKEIIDKDCPIIVNLHSGYLPTHSSMRDFPIVVNKVHYIHRDFDDNKTKGYDHDALYRPVIESYMRPNRILVGLLYDNHVVGSVESNDPKVRFNEAGAKKRIWDSQRRIQVNLTKIIRRNNTRILKQMNVALLRGISLPIQSWKYKYEVSWLRSD